MNSRWKIQKCLSRPKKGTTPINRTRLVDEYYDYPDAKWCSGYWERIWRKSLQ